MICPKCGKENMDDSNYCEACGAELHTETAEQQIQQQTEQQINDIPKNTQQQINSYMTFSIIMTVITTICCCLPFGIIAVVYSSKVNNLISIGDIQGAVEASKKAKMWNIISLLLSLMLVIIYIVIFFIGALAAIASVGSYRLPYLIF